MAGSGQPGIYNRTSDRFCLRGLRRPAAKEQMPAGWVRERCAVGSRGRPWSYASRSTIFWWFLLSGARGRPTAALPELASVHFKLVPCMDGRIRRRRTGNRNFLRICMRGGEKGRYEWESLIVKAHFARHSCSCCPHVNRHPLHVRCRYHATPLLVLRPCHIP